MRAILILLLTASCSDAKLCNVDCVGGTNWCTVEFGKPFIRLNHFDNMHPKDANHFCAAYLGNSNELK